MPRFLPRLQFTYANNHASWHPGHMKAFMDRLTQSLVDMDMVIECRDARIPLTSINPKLENAVDAAWGPNWQDEANGGPRETGRNRERLIVYTKRDLAEKRFEEVSRREGGRRRARELTFGLFLFDRSHYGEPSGSTRNRRSCSSMARTLRIRSSCYGKLSVCRFPFSLRVERVD